MQIINHLAAGQSSAKKRTLLNAFWRKPATRALTEIRPQFMSPSRTKPAEEQAEE